MSTLLSNLEVANLDFKGVICIFHSGISLLKIRSIF